MKKIFIAGTVFILLACSDESELKRSVFINDPDAPGLPKYSEWGYNTFGAYYNRDIVVSNDYEVPVQVIQQTNATTFQFKGQKGSNYWGDFFSIILTIQDFNPSSYQDLMALHQTVIDLTDDRYSVSITDATSTRSIQLLNGTFEIKRAQFLLVDGDPEEVILSGVFEFQAIIDGEPVSISEGRFDVGVGSYNFFKY